MHEPLARIEQLRRDNRRLKLACAALASVLLLGVGVAMQDGPGPVSGLRGEAMVQGGLSVNESTGFAVFVRSDGNLVIVQRDGKVTQTEDQPMAVRF